jgi:hypothetical protein
LTKYNTIILTHGLAIVCENETIFKALMLGRGHFRHLNQNPIIIQLALRKMGYAPLAFK